MRFRQLFLVLVLLALGYFLLFATGGESSAQNELGNCGGILQPLVNYNGMLMPDAGVNFRSVSWPWAGGSDGEIVLVHAEATRYEVCAGGPTHGTVNKIIQRNNMVIFIVSSGVWIFQGGEWEHSLAEEAIYDGCDTFNNLHLGTLNGVIEMAFSTGDVIALDLPSGPYNTVLCNEQQLIAVGSRDEGGVFLPSYNERGDIVGWLERATNQSREMVAIDDNRFVDATDGNGLKYIDLETDELSTFETPFLHLRAVDVRGGYLAIADWESGAAYSTDRGASWNVFYRAPAYDVQFIRLNQSIVLLVATDYGILFWPIE